MKALLIYFFLFSYWAEVVIGIRLTNFRGVSFFNLSIYIFLFFWLVSIIKEKKLLKTHDVNKYLFIMVCIILLSIPNKVLRGEIPDISLLTEIINIKSFLNPILLFYVLFNVVDDEKTCNRAIVGLLLLLLCTLLSQMLGLFGVIRYGEIAEAGSSRVTGLGDPNDFASFLVLLIPILLSSFLFQKSALVKFSSAVLLSLSFIGLLATGSRGGVISFSFSMFVYCLFLFRERIFNFSKIMVFVGALFLAGGATLALMPTTLQKELVDRFDPTVQEGVDAMTAGRTLIWRKGLLLFMESPIIGHGHHVFKTLLTKKYYVQASAHNQYLDYAVCYGIIGLGFLLMVYLKLFQYVWRQYCRTSDSWKKKIYISFFAGFCGYLFSLMSITMSKSGYIFWVYTAIVSIYSRLDMKEKNK